MLPNDFDLLEFARLYTAAWCSQSAAEVASFFSPDGSLKVNDSPPAHGRVAITETAQSFMTAFPDMQVIMDDAVSDGEGAVYRWTLIGTNNGTGGTGHKVRISGYELWKIGQDGLIAESNGHFDAADYQFQLEHGVS